MILGALLHIICSSVIALFLSLVVGYLTTWSAALSLLVGAWLGWRLARSIRGSHPEWTFAWFHRAGESGIEKALALLALYFSVRQFLWIFYLNDHAYFSMNANNFGDLPLHINYIRMLANGLRWPWPNPSFAGELLRYPLGVDLYSALWERLGVPLSAHFFVVGMVLTVAALVALRSFAGWWGIGAFFFNGGLAGWAILEGVPLPDLQSGVEWKNFLLAVFVPQRGMMVAVPVALLLLKTVRDHSENTKVLSSRQLKVLGVIWGVLPFFHLHAFFAVSLLLLAIALERRGVQGFLEFWRSPLFLSAVLPATAFLLYSTDGLSKASVARWAPGWSMSADENFLPFMARNFGYWLLLPIAIVFGLLRSRTSRRADFSSARRRGYWIELGVYMGLLLLFFLIMLAPWAWDNIKVLLWPYLGLARLARIVLQPQLGRLAQVAIAVLLLFSGFMMQLQAVYFPKTPAVEIYTLADLAHTEGALSQVPVDAVFAAASTHHHPLTYFGRIRVIGYEGHLWSHGIEAGDRVEKQKRLMGKVSSEIPDDDWKSLARELGVTHIFWGPEERRQFGEGFRPWMKELENVSRVPGYEVYETGL